MTSGQTLGSILSLLFAVHAFASEQASVTVEPACPSLNVGDNYNLGSPRITITYRPPFIEGGKWSLIMADAIGPARLEERTIPMTRLADDTWQAAYTPAKVYGLGYSMFFFQDENHHVDNNHGQYWEILHCFQSQVVPLAIDIQASTYEGRLMAPGIQREPDLDRAIAILQAALTAFPAEAEHYFRLWDFELKKGGYSQAAYRQVGTELETFLSTNETDFRAMRQILGFVSGLQSQLPPESVQQFRKAWIALPQTAQPIQINSTTKEPIHIPSTNGPAIARFRAALQPDLDRGIAQLDYQAIDSDERDPHTRVLAYLAFATQHPTAPDLPNAYASIFRCDKELGDIAAAEAIFDKWIAVDPLSVQPNLELAKFYLERKIKPARTLELLDAVQRIYTTSDLPTSHVHFRRQPGELESLCGQAHLLLKDMPAARADFAAATKAAPDDPGFAYALGQTCEQMKDITGALDAYLAAASAPYEENAAPHEAYERLFVAQHLGTSRAADDQIAWRAAERIQSAAHEYKPIAMNRPAPDFSFTDFSGKHVDNETAKGKPTVLTFWGIWCPPCIAELPAIEAFQKQHPAVNMLAVEIGNTPDEVKAFLASHGLNTLRVAARTDWPEAFGTNAAPATDVLDTLGQIQFIHVGKLANVEAILEADISALPALNY